MQYREREQRRAGQGRNGVEGAEPPRIARERGARRRKRGFRLRREHHPLRQHEARAEGFVRPGKDRIPRVGLSGDEPFGSFGAVAHEIGGEIFLRFRGHRGRRIGDAVEDRIGQAGERHFRRVDDVALRLPFGGERRGQRAGGRGQRPARRCLHRAAVEQDAEAALAFRNLGPPIEPPAQLRPHGAPRRLGRVERLLGENLLEQVAHGVNMGCERRSFNLFDVPRPIRRPCCLMRFCG